MPRRKLRLEPNEQEKECLEAIKRVHKAGPIVLTAGDLREQFMQTALETLDRINKAGPRELTEDEVRDLFKRLVDEDRKLSTFHGEMVPAWEWRKKDEKIYQYKAPKSVRWRDYMPLAYQNAKAERDYLVMVEQAKIKRPTGGVEARKAQGERTRKLIFEAWNQSTLPERNRAARIAKTLKLLPRYVRKVLRTR